MDSNGIRLATSSLYDMGLVIVTYREKFTGKKGAQCPPNGSKWHLTGKKALWCP